MLSGIEVNFPSILSNFTRANLLVGVVSLIFIFYANDALNHLF